MLYVPERILLYFASSTLKQTPVTRFFKKEAVFPANFNVSLLPFSYLRAMVLSKARLRPIYLYTGKKIEAAGRSYEITVSHLFVR